METRQSKQEALILAIIAESVAELPSVAATSIQLAPRQFESTVSSLITFGSQYPVSGQYWWNLKKVAEILGLRHLYAPLRQKRMQANAKRAS